ncbi:hypothetical protein FRX31_026181 [Thalictrum thalictroides]|uniref:BED-type domain-containing protein n=1 Tax=Thalictrum thalictroides TaxID=46969 RepID=A0A7J6VIU6_THATH|nr:hypothetical protein FRX31_026181 [Thalictrum thalictroides]
MENVVDLLENNPIDLDLDNDMEDVDNVEEQISTGKSGTSKKRSRTFLSKWWSYFTIFPGVDENGRVRATCKKCGQIVNAESNQGTGNIKKHVQKCQAVTYRDIGQMVIGTSDSSLSTRPSKFNPEESFVS